MIELIAGFALTMISLLVGFSLGKNQTVVTQDVKKQIQQIFTRVVPRNDGVGIVERPNAQQVFYRDNPQYAKIQQEATQDFDTLSQHV